VTSNAISAHYTVIGLCEEQNGHSFQQFSNVIGCDSLHETNGVSGGTIYRTAGTVNSDGLFWNRSWTRPM